MGRKIELKKIEDCKKSQVTFSKRRANLIKKIQEISIHCDVDVAFLAFSSAGRISKFSNRERIEDLLDRYVTLPVEKRLSHIKNTQEKRKRVQELAKIRTKEGSLYYLNNQIENLELQVKINEVEAQRIEAHLRDFEVSPEQEPSFNLLSFCEANLKQAIEKVKERKKETLALEKEQGTSSWLYNDDNLLHGHGGTSSSQKRQHQVQFGSWKNNEYLVPKNLFNEMLGKGKEKVEGDACSAFEITKLQLGLPEKQAPVPWPQIESNSSSLGYFAGERSNLITRDLLYTFTENSYDITNKPVDVGNSLEMSMLPNQPKWDFNDIAVANKEAANNKENHDDTREIIAPLSFPVLEAPSSASKVPIHFYDFFPSK